MIQKALEIYEKGNKYYSENEIKGAYQSYFLFVTLATFIFSKREDKMYVNVMLSDATKKSMDILEHIKDEVDKEWVRPQLSLEIFLDNLFMKS